MRPYIYMSGKIRSMATSSYTRIFGDAAGIIKNVAILTDGHPFVVNCSHYRIFALA
ncbi:MAG: hypothetical protein LIR46_04785 [Bacteroidota bacterium]|nr:hypothetical protein [Bacteroidota bacterium]